MNSNLRRVFRNFAYAFGANSVDFIISALMIIFIPKFLGVEGYGYWQLYLFYNVYFGYLHFGWKDGIYLRYGGKYYKELDKKTISTQFWMFCILILFLAILLSTLFYYNLADENKSFILISNCIYMLLLLPRGFLTNILQATNKIQESSKIIVVDRLLFCIILVISLFGGVKSYHIIIFIDLFSKLISLFLAMFYCKDLILSKLDSFKQGVKEAWINCNAGIKLLIGYLAGVLVIGIIRFSVENKWGIETFGRVSLSLSLSNAFMIFIAALSMVLFPMLRRISADKQEELYSVLRTALMIPLLGALIVYEPIVSIMTWWLPQYSESLRYLALLFPICIFESKMEMLVNTYLKTLRKEKWILMVNVITVILSFIITVITVYILENIILSILSIVFLLAFRSVFAEILLRKVIKIKISKDICWEITLTIIFISSSWFISGWISMILYGLFYVFYLLCMKKEIKNIVSVVKEVRQ